MAQLCKMLDTSTGAPHFVSVETKNINAEADI